MTSAYLTAAVAKDWPAMERETNSPEVTEALSRIYYAVFKFMRSTATKGWWSPRSCGRSIK